MLSAVLLRPELVYADHDASQKVGIWLYIGIVLMAMLLILVITVIVNVRRPVNPHTGLPSRSRRHQRRR